VKAPWNRNVKLAMNVRELRVNAMEHTAKLTTQSGHAIFIGRQCSLLQMINESGGSTFYPFVSACEACTAFSVVASDANKAAVVSFYAAEKAASKSNIVGDASWPRPLLNLCAKLLDILHKGTMSRMLHSLEGNTSADKDNTTSTMVRVPTIVSTLEGNGTTIVVTPAEDNTTDGNTTAVVRTPKEDNTTSDNPTEGNNTTEDSTTDGNTTEDTPEGKTTTEDNTTDGNTTTVTVRTPEEDTTSDNPTEGNATEGSNITEDSPTEGTTIEDTQPWCERRPQFSLSEFFPKGDWRLTITGFIDLHG